MIKITNQKGAMFGLDARIALAIFGSLSAMIVGYALKGLNDVHGKGLAKEFRDTAIAVELLHKDLREDIHNSLTTENDANAFAALHNGSLLKNSTLIARWNGPYIRGTSTHNQYGAWEIEKAKDDHVSACDNTETCYLWLTLASVPANTVTALNEVFDGKGEASAESSGVLHWSGVGENKKVFYRMTRALAL